MELEKHVMEIVKFIENGYPDAPEDSDEERGAYEYLNDALDIEYTVNSKKEYLGARILVAFGGPNIWVDTRQGTVEGHWWGESFTWSYFTDALGLDEACEDIFSAN